MEYIRFIKRLKDTGMPLKEIKRYADLRYEGNRTISDRLELLRAYRPLLSERLEQYRVYLEKLDDKIALYEEAIIRENCLPHNSFHEKAYFYACRHITHRGRVNENKSAPIAPCAVLPEQDIIKAVKNIAGE